MIKRSLSAIAFCDAWGRQMRFISGPRQSGKTTLAKQKLADDRQTRPLYYLWDQRAVRNRYWENELFFTADAPPSGKKIWLCFDEIHKMPKWKNILKAIFDEMQNHYSFIITGSAKFDTLRKAGDSLSGRYFTFTLYPLSLDEVLNTFQKNLEPPADILRFIASKTGPQSAAQEAMESLLAFSGFPEPFVMQKRPFLNKWTADYVDTVIRDDINPLTRIVESDHLYDLYRLLPEMAGGILSESSLASHVQVSPVTLKRYLKRLQDFYLIFQLHPYTKNIKRSLLRATKGYLFNWVTIGDEGARFENYVACELKTRTSRWSEYAGGNYDLYYVRNQLKQEADFLVTRNGAPWFLVETKLKDAPLDRHLYEFSSGLNVPIVQLCREGGVAMLQKSTAFRISASRFFS